MADVLAFPPRDQDKVVWRCNCGCLSFALRDDGEAECAQCGDVVTGQQGEWRSKLPDVESKPQELGAGDVTVTDLNSSPASMRRTLGRADPHATAAVIIIQAGGEVSTWGVDIETQEQSAWFDRRVEVAKSMLTKRHADVARR
jgi:hypothetical protein